jgi:DNA topoisomerase-1
MDRMLTYEMNRKKLDQKKAAATALKIMLLTGMRVGGGKGRTGMTGGEETYGTASLERRHIRVSGDKVVFDYKGKVGVQQHHEAVDADLANAVRAFMGGHDETSPSDRTPLFQCKAGRAVETLTRYDVGKRLKKFDPDYKPKDLRTLKANTIASEEVARMLDEPIQHPATKREKKKFIKKAIDRVTDKVANVLGNTKSVAKSNYINPYLIEAALAEMGLS